MLTDSKGYPFIGLEYEYLGQPVKLTRMVPTADDCHVEFTTRFSSNSQCAGSELGDWRNGRPLSANEKADALDAMEDALRQANSDEERTAIERPMSDIY